MQSKFTVLFLAALLGTTITVLIGTLTTEAFAQACTNPEQNCEKGTPRQNPGPQDDPECWGEVTSGLAHVDDGHPGIGEHVSNPVPNNDSPHDTPRTGIGNQPEDTPAQHGAVVGPAFGQTCEDPRDE